MAPLPPNEQERLEALNEYHILDTLPESDFDDITRIASEVCKTPISLVTIIDADRQWHKSNLGLHTPAGEKETESPRKTSFCAHAILTPELELVVPDAKKDARFADNPSVTGEPFIGFYAGIPLVNPEGFALGTLCVLDHKPHTLTDDQLKTLKALARQVVCQLELRRKNTQLKEQQAELQNAYNDLEKFSYIASHDLKSPLNNIISLTHLLKDDYSNLLDEEGNEYINFLNDSAYQLSDMVNGILHYSKSSQLLLENKEYINIAQLIQEVVGLQVIPENCLVYYETGNKQIFTSRIALKQILLNLLHNAIRYGNQENIKIEIFFTESSSKYTFEIKDNGPGIDPKNQDKIFDLFERLQKKTKDGEGSGIGLAIVKRLVEKLGGSIKVVSDLGMGASFIFTIPK
jgi:hypothetical protein